MPRHKHPLSRLLIAWLHFRQPIARGWARHSVMLKARVLGTRTVGLQVPRELPLDPHSQRVLRYWSDNSQYVDRVKLLEHISTNVQKVHWRMRMDSGWYPFDVELYLSRYVRVRLMTATEHHAKGLLTRVRVQVMISTFMRLLLVGSSLLTILLLTYLWPFSRAAVLIPLVWWCMYLISKQSILGPVMALLHQSALEAGLVPVKGKPGDPAP